MGRVHPLWTYRKTYLTAVILLVFAVLCIHPRKKNNKSSAETASKTIQTHRHYHACTLGTVPYITPPLETAYSLLHSNMSFIRYGDSEILLMSGGSEPFQSYSSSLAESLETAFTDNNSNLMIGLQDPFSKCPMWAKDFADWWDYSGDPYRQWVFRHGNMSRHYYSAMISSVYIHTHGTNCTLLDELYTTLRAVWKDKDIVLLRGDNKQKYEYDIYDTARHTTIYLAPRYQAWKAYSKLKKVLLSEDPEQLFVLTAGPVAKVLTYDLMKAGRRALDLGHLAKDYNAYKMGVIPPDFFERYEQQ